MQVLNLSLKKVIGCKNNPQKSSITKVGEHILCGYSMSTIWEFNNGTENKHDACRDEDCMKKFGESLKEHAMKVVNL